MNKGRAAFSVLLTLFLCTVAFAQGPKTVEQLREGKTTLSYDDMTALFAADPAAVLVDCRGEKAYAQGHLPGAINIPGWELDKNLQKLPDKKTTVVTYCDGSGCSVSYYVADKLLEMGWKKVAVFDGGMRELVKNDVFLINEKTPPLNPIYRADVVLLAQSGASGTLIDTRPAGVGITEGIPGSRRLSAVMIREGSILLPPEKKAMLVLFGASKIDPSPYQAAEKFRELGYSDLRIYTDGVAGYLHGK